MARTRLSEQVWPEFKLRLPSVATALGAAQYLMQKVCLKIVTRLGAITS